MNRLLQNIFGIHKGEVERAKFMFVYIFLLIASLLIAKPLRNSLFLNELGADKLPFVFILVALISGSASIVYNRFMERFSLGRRIGITIVLFSIGFIFFWILLNGHQVSVISIYALYIWVALYGLLTASHFWLLANYVFNVREAKRVFSFLAGGGIAGGIFGGYLTQILALLIGTHNLLLICTLFLLSCLIILKIVWTKSAQSVFNESEARSRRVGTPARIRNPLKLVINSPQLTNIAGIIAISVIVANLIDYQFNAVAEQSFKNQPDKLTAFFGFWLSNLSIISLIFQFFITGRVIRSLGVGISLNFLPTGIFLGSIIMIAVPGLGAAIILKIAEGGLKQSINKAGIELLSLPVPASIKNKTKSVIDIFIDNAATGISGILLIAFSYWQGFDLRGISVLVLIFLFLWFYLVRQAHLNYIEAFRSAIERRTLDFRNPSLDPNNTELIKNLLNVLKGNNIRQILYALRLLENTSNELLIPHLKRLIAFDSPEVKSQVLRMAYNLNRDILLDEARKLIEDKDEQVRICAIRYLTHALDNREEMIRILKTSQNFYTRAAALLCIAEEVGTDKNWESQINFVQLSSTYLFENGIQAVSKSELIYLKQITAKIIGLADNSQINSGLRDLLSDSDCSVQSIAVESAGKIKDPQLLEKLIDLLNNRHHRSMIRSSLSRYGNEALPLLEHKINDKDTPLNLKLEILIVLERIGTKASSQSLINHLNSKDRDVAVASIDSLLRLHIRKPDIKLPISSINRAIIREAKNYYYLVAIYDRHHDFHAKSVDKITPEGQKAFDFLSKTIRERLAKNLERIFKLLALKFRADDMYNAWKSVTSSDNAKRVNAVEYLDNLIDPYLRLYIIPIIEQNSMDELISKLTDLYGPSVPIDMDYREALLEGTDTWLKATTIFLIAFCKMENKQNILEAFKNSMIPLIRETAEFTAQKQSVVSQEMV